MSYPPSLDYDWYHVQFAAPFMLGKNAENDLYFEQQAQEMHAGAVSDGILNIYTLIVGLFDILSDVHAEQYARYGVLRRMRMIDASFRSIRSIAYAERTVPLSTKQCGIVERDLNAIYTNIAGCLDNVAWVLREELGSEEAKALEPIKIGLDSKTFLKLPEFHVFSKSLKDLQPWIKEVKQKRNPAVHRIPLTIPPALITPEQEEQRRMLAEAISKETDRDKRAQLLDQVDGVGTFCPMFLHKPDEERFELYPTLPEDIASLLKVVKIGCQAIADCHH